MPPLKFHPAKEDLVELVACRRLEGDAHRVLYELRDRLLFAKNGDLLRKLFDLLGEFGVLVAFMIDPLAMNAHPVATLLQHGSHESEFPGAWFLAEELVNHLLFVQLRILIIEIVQTCTLPVFLYRYFIQFARSQLSVEVKSTLSARFMSISMSRTSSSPMLSCVFGFIRI